MPGRATAVDVAKSVGVKAVRTFVQAFLASLALSAASVTDLTTARSAAVAAGAAGGAAVWRLVDLTRVPSLVDQHNRAGVPPLN